MGYAVGVTNSLRTHSEDVDAVALAAADTERCMALVAVVAAKAAAGGTFPVAVEVAV
jgi:hypothetical protein